jgi:hypothetical protein
MVDESGSEQKREALRVQYSAALQKLEGLFNIYIQHATKANENIVKELTKEKEEDKLVTSLSVLEDNVTKRIQAVENLVATKSNKTLKGGYDQLRIITTNIKVLLGEAHRALKIRKQALITVQSKNHDEIKLINDIKIALTKGDLRKVRSLIKKLNDDLTAEKNLIVSVQSMLLAAIEIEKKVVEQKKAFVVVYSKIASSKSAGSTLPTARF